MVLVREELDKIFISLCLGFRFYNGIEENHSFLAENFLYLREKGRRKKESGHLIILKDVHYDQIILYMGGFLCSLGHRRERFVGF